MARLDDAAPTPSEARQLANEQARLAVAQGRRGRLAQLAVDVVLIGLVVSLGASWVLWFYVPWQLCFLYGRHGLLDRRTRQGRLSLVEQHRWLARTGLLMAVGFAGLQLAAFQQPVGAPQFLITMCMFGVVAGTVATAAGDVRGYVAVVLLVASNNALCWLVWGGPLGWLPALAMFVLGATLTDQVRNQRIALHSQVRLRMQLDTALQESRTANEARTRFFAAASHDLRQPLTALGYNVATLEALARLGEPVPPEQLAPLAAGLRRSLRESQTLLGSLLEVSQLDAGAVEPQMQTVALVPLVEDLLALLRAEAEQRGLCLRFAHPAHDKMAVRSDPRCSVRASA